MITTGRAKRIPKTRHQTFHVVAPKELSFSRNFEETVNFFKEIKEVALLIAQRREISPRYVAPFSIALGPLEVLSVRCAVVFAAEMDRLRRIAGARLEFPEHLDAVPEALTMLKQIGCFVLLDIPNALNGHTIQGGPRILIPIISGRKCEDRKFEEFETSVKRICSGYRTLSVVHEGMAEAMLNVVHHAYLDTIPFKYPPAGKRWWATACHNIEDGEIKILVYDQGHGIPVTLPHSGFKELMTATLDKATLGILNDDATLLEGALQYARSRTNDTGRGKGFRNIMKSIKELSDGRLRILSARAEVTISQADGTISSSFKHHIGGTLIEWTFPVSDFE